MKKRRPRRLPSGLHSDNSAPLAANDGVLAAGCELDHEVRDGRWPTTIGLAAFLAHMDGVSIPKGNQMDKHLADLYDEVDQIRLRALEWSEVGNSDDVRVVAELTAHLAACVCAIIRKPS